MRRTNKKCSGLSPDGKTKFDSTMSDPSQTRLGDGWKQQSVPYKDKRDTSESFDSDRLTSIRYDSTRLDSGYNSMSLSSRKTSCDTSKEYNFDSGTSVGYSDLDSNFQQRLCLDDPEEKSSLPRGDKWEDSGLRLDSGLGIDTLTPLSSGMNIHCLEDDPEESSHSVAKYPEVHSVSEDIDKAVLIESFTQDNDGDTLLHLAIIQGIVDVVFTIIQLVPHPDFLDIFNNFGQTPLHLALLMGHHRIVRRLVVAGATIDLRDHKGNAPLHLACERGYLECVKALISPVLTHEVEEAVLKYPVRLHCAPLELLEAKNYEGQASIHLATSGGHKHVIDYLISYGADVTCQDGKSGRMPLHYAVEAQDVDLVLFLLSNCFAPVNGRNYAGQTALEIAWALCKKNENRTTSRIVWLLKKFHGEPQDPVDTASDSDDESSSSENGDNQPVLLNSHGM